nr:CHAT domain-containing protein [candidate division Zixibacteria bacterium]
MIDLSHIQDLNSRSAVEAFISDRYDDNVLDFLHDLDRGINRLIRTDLKKSARYLEAVKRIFRYLPPNLKPRLFAIQGRFHHWTGQYGSALRYYRMALREFRRRRNTEAVARLGKGLMDVYMYLGRYREALNIGRDSLNFFRRNRFQTDAGQILNNIGNVYHRMDNNHQALSHYNRALEIFGEEDSVSRAIVQYNRANVYTNLNQLRKAEELYRSAAELYRRSGMEIAETQAEYSLAYLYFLEDRYTEAATVFEAVYNKFNALGDVKSATNARLDMVEIDIQLNQYGSAIMAADEIIPEFGRLGMRYEQAKACFFAAEARIKLGDYVLASRRLRTAESLFVREDNNHWLGMIHITKSRLMIARRRFADTLRETDRAIERFVRSGNERRRIDAEIIKIEAMMQKGDIRGALKLAGTFTDEKLVSYQLYNLHCVIGQCYYNLREYDVALDKFREAVWIVEKMLEGLYPDEISYFFVIDKYYSYKMVVDCLLKLGRIQDSFISNLKALEIINRKAASERHLEKEVPQELVNRRDELRAALKKMNQSPRDSQRQAYSYARYFALEQELWANERKIRACLYPDRIKKDNGLGANDDIIGLLRPDETIVNFITTGAITGVFCVNRNKTEFAQLELNHDVLESLLRRLHFVFESVVSGYKYIDEAGLAAETYLKEIYRLVFKPIRSHLTGDRIIIMADGSFGQIPFNALKDENNHYLMEDFRLSYAVNPDDLRDRTELAGLSEWKNNAIFAISGDLLPSIEIEARRIKDIFGQSKVYYDQAADRQSLLKEIGRADGFLHIAAHASRSSENPLFSRILMGDGPFYPFDLFETGIRAKLVTLSGCQTAAPGLYYGNSFSLAKAFYQAGGRFVLATLWPVADKVSMLFMIRFYQALAEKENIHEAYWKTVRSMIDVTDNPAFWSSFVLLGI